MLIFLAVNMPVMGGIEFLAACQQLPPARRPAVVVGMLTTSANPRDHQRTTALPVATYLAQPLTQQQGEQVVAQHFSAQQ